jgi:5,10-methylenetetrahydromethanopterin reductase
VTIRTVAETIVSKLALDLGSYVLPGKITTPGDAIRQAQSAERIGLGSVWAAERWENKESGAVCGALSLATSRVNIVTGVTHFITRHPLVLAGMAATLQGLSGGRFILGVGRSWGQRWIDMGLTPQTNAAMTDYARILRALWAGEVVAYDGVAGRYPKMQMADIPQKAPPIYITAIGPKTLALAGQHFDGVFLMPFLTTESVARSCEIVRAAARAANRDPASVRIIACLVVAPDLSEVATARAVHARAASYFIHRWLAEPIVKVNGWDTGAMERLLALPLQDEEVAKRDEEQVKQSFLTASRLIPQEWIDAGAGVGSAAKVAERLRAYRAAGADEIVLHGTTPDQPEMEALIRAYLK